MCELPPSELDSDDYPPGPNGMAALCEARIAELEGWRKILPRAERRPVNQHIHTLRGMVRWCKSRAGYVDGTDLEG